MNLPQGYKQTELGIIPEDWEVINLGSIAKINGRIGFRGYTVNDLVGAGQGAYAIGGKHIAQLTLDLSEPEYISWKKYYESPEIMVKQGDIVFAQRGTLGRSALISQNIGPATINPSLVLINNIKCNNIYLSHWIQSERIIKYVCSINSQTSIPMITQKQIEHIPVILPPLSEQKAIAEALSDVDELITALDKKIAKKRLIKQGAMQELLTGKKRLPGFTEEWVEDTIANVCDILDNKRVPLNEEQRKKGVYPYCGANGIVEYIDKYIFSEDLILIAEDGGNFDQFESRPIAYWMTGKYWVNNHAHVLKVKHKYSQRYIFYQLEHKDITDYIVGGTRTKLTRFQLDRITIKLPQTKEEQQAIATILSDMDKEIADLEAQRDKYRLVKSGMMQKLLTGEIRLKKPQVSQISESKAIPVDAHIIAGHIVNRLYKSEGWGRTKLQKSLHLAGYYAQIYIGNEYIRNTAGPDDQRLMDYIDQQFRQFNHVKITREKLRDGKIHYNYTPTSLIHEVEMVYAKYPENVRKQIDLLLDKMNIMDLDRAEILSTLYAVWNNRIIKGERITDDLLISDFYAWSKHKLEFDESRLRRALVYMRKENIVPTGWGKYIDKKN